MKLTLEKYEWANDWKVRRGYLLIGWIKDTGFVPRNNNPIPIDELEQILEFMKGLKNES